MKKILSLTLSVIMLLSVMPFSYMVSAKVTSPEALAFLEAYWKADVYSLNIYEINGVVQQCPDELSDELNDIVLEAIYEAEECLPVDKTKFYNYEFLTDSANAEALLEAAKIFKAAISKLEAHLESRGATLVIDLYEFAYKIPSFDIIYPSEKLEALYNSEKFIENSEEFRAANWGEEGDVISNYMKNIKWNDDSNKDYQAQFDAIVAEKYYPFFEKIYNCLEEKHNPGEFVSNNDATYEADGTKTAECEFCGATVTVVDEGSKLQKEEGKLSFIDKLIAFIKSIFEKILSIFG